MRPLQTDRSLPFLRRTNKIAKKTTGVFDFEPFSLGLQNGRPLKMPVPKLRQLPSTEDLLSPAESSGNHIVAKSLGLTLDQRTFTFSQKPPNKTCNGISDDFEQETNIQKPESRVEPRILLSDCLVQAPGLRNDYYSNLVSYTAQNNRVVVGLSIMAYLWGLADHRVTPVVIDTSYKISCVSCSKNDLALVGTTGGTVLVASLRTRKPQATIAIGQKPIHCLVWLEDSKSFLVSDHEAQVYLLSINGTPDSNSELPKSLEVKHVFKVHKQLVCAVTEDRSMAAFGGNDNLVTLWDIRDITKPLLRFVFEHKAAIKALAFCPWAPSLLATGGGSKDRTIKFWHTKSGTLVRSFSTESQITSIWWSISCKQFAVTFGFGTNSSVLAVYSFPDMRLVAHVPATRELRLLSSSLSPDGKHLCVAASDTTIRIYQLWDGKKFTGTSRGVYGSDLIELLEGTYRNEGVVR